MNHAEREVVRWLYQELSNPSASAIAYEFLLENDAQRYPAHPQDGHDLAKCLQLMDQVPETKPAIERLAARSKYWAALQRHWDTLADKFAQETNGRTFYPSPITTYLIQGLTGRVSSGQNLPDIIMPDSPNCNEHDQESNFTPTNQ